MGRSELGLEIEKGLMDALRWSRGEIELKTTTLEKITIIKLLQRIGLTRSVSDGKRVVALGVVKLNDEIITDLQIEVVVKTGDVLEVGCKKMIL